MRVEKRPEDMTHRKGSRSLLTFQVVSKEGNTFMLYLRNVDIMISGAQHPVVVFLIPAASLGWGQATTAWWGNPASR